MNPWNDNEIAGKANADVVSGEQKHDGAKQWPGKVAGAPRAREQPAHGVVESE